MSDSYVTSKATIKCSCGDKCAKLTVYPDRTVFLTEKPMANISDHISMYNIAPFGKCRTTAYPPTGAATAANHGRLTPMPCIPGTVTEWINGKKDYLVKGKSALLKTSYCRCQWGGIITITDDGQIDTGDADIDKLALETAEEWNIREQEEFLEDKDTLLDGIQMALDLAGFTPGIGAIPDLLNAAIYAVRGDKLNASLSLLAAVPGIGDAAAAAKIAGKGVRLAKSAKKAEQAITETGKVVDMAKYKAAKKAKMDQLIEESDNVKRLPARNIDGNAASPNNVKPHKELEEGSVKKTGELVKISEFKAAKTQNAIDNSNNITRFPEENVSRIELSKANDTQKRDNVIKMDKYEKNVEKQVNGSDIVTVTKKTEEVENVVAMDRYRVNPVQKTTYTGSSMSYGAGQQNNGGGMNRRMHDSNRIKVLKNKKKLTDEELAELIKKDKSTSIFYKEE